MERNDTPSDLLDQLISDTLRSRLGPVPSQEVWQRIAKDLAHPVPARPSLLARLARLLQTPVAQSGMIVALMALLIVQPAYYWMNKDYPVQRISIPQVTPRSQYLPDDDLLVAYEIDYLPLGIGSPGVEAQ